MFNLKHDGGIFIGLYDNGEAAQGTEPFPQGTGVTWKGVPGTAISVPQPSATRNLPDSEASLSPHIVKLSNSNYGNDGIIEVSPVEMSHLTQPLNTSHPGGLSVCFLAGLAKIKRSCSPKMANTTNATLTALRMLVGVSLTVAAMAQNAGESTCLT